MHTFNPLFASGDFSRLLITFAISLDPDQEQQNIGPVLGWGGGGGGGGGERCQNAQKHFIIKTY